MSTSYSIYRFAKPTKRELAGIHYYSEYDSFPIYDSNGEQIKQIRYDDLNFYKKTVQTKCMAVKMKCLWNSDDEYCYLDKKRVLEYIPALQEYRFVPVNNSVLAKAEILFLIFERNRGKCFIEMY